MRLRLAVHAGPVFLGGDIGWPGQHTVLPVRLRDCEPVRAAMKAVRAADLAVIVSGDVYRDYITQGPGSPRPTEFRAVLARPKKAAYLGHLMIPGFDVHAIGALARYDVPDEGRSAQHDAGDALDRELPPTAGRDFINGDKNRVSGGGSIYRSGRDIIIPGNQP
jgi:hypothetical protein